MSDSAIAYQFHWFINSLWLGNEGLGRVPSAQPSQIEVVANKASARIARPENLRYPPISRIRFYSHASPEEAK